LPQDLPFGVINTLFLLRQVDCWGCSWGDGCTGPRCADSYSSTTFCVLLVVLLTSVACLVYKLLMLLTIPELWHERNRLRAVKTELEMRARRLEMLVPGPEGGGSGSDSDSDSTGEAEGAWQVPGGSTLHSGPSPLREDTIFMVAISQGALDVDDTWPTRKAVVVTTFEIAVLPKCGR
jgi:hypothetical protein